MKPGVGPGSARACGARLGGFMASGRAVQNTSDHVKTSKILGVTRRRALVLHTLLIYLANPKHKRSRSVIDLSTRILSEEEEEEEDILLYYTGAVPQLEQPVYYKDLGYSL
jgi:precorrin-3B methylase